MSPPSPFARLQWDGRTPRTPAPADLELDSIVAGNDSAGPPTDLPRLLHGENLAVMQALQPEFEGQIDLIYVDPPFLTGKAYAARVGRGEDSRKPDDWETAPGYRDQWSDGAAYLSMLYPRLQAMYDLLAPTGTLYLHLDWHASAYARVLLDEIFGPDRLLNEIVWVYHGPSPIRSAFNRKHDTILAYTKTDEYTFNADAVRVPYSDSTVKTFAASDKAGFGKQPDLERGKVPEDWWYFPVVARMHNERTGYPTQKPEALLERIVMASSNPGDLVADFFSGAGTTPAVAHRCQRRWLACDLSPLAMRTSYRRLLLEDASASFTFWTSQPVEQPQLEPVWREESEGQIRLMGMGGSKAPQSFPESVVFWELDPDYDGEVFRSRVARARPWRDDELPLRIEMSGGRRPAVRAADTLGAWGVSAQPEA